MTTGDGLNFARWHSELPRAFGVPTSPARFRVHPDDFTVTEIAGFEPEGRGDHLCLYVRKTGLNTHEVLDRIQRVSGAKPVDIGYFGLKDKHAVTDQWFSVHLPGKDDAALVSICDQLCGPGIVVLNSTRHRRKFRIGTHESNRFSLVLREITGDPDDINARMDKIVLEGFPNYFGEQRFGIDGGNLSKARSMFCTDEKQQRRSRRISRRKQSYYLSAARSFLFNELLGARLQTGNWLTPMPDEKLVLDGSRSFFINSDHTQNGQTIVNQRISALDVHTSGPLWGRASADAQFSEWEIDAVSGYPDFSHGLETAGLNHERRALRAQARHLTRRWLDESTLELDVELVAGTYATSLLREIVIV